MRQTKKSFDPFLQDLQNLVEMIFSLPPMQKTVSELSDKTKLSVSTIRKLQKGEVGYSTHYRTIQKLASAVGLIVWFAKARINVREARRQ